VQKAADVGYIAPSRIHIFRHIHANLRIEVAPWQH